MDTTMLKNHVLIKICMVILSFLFLPYISFTYSSEFKKQPNIVESSINFLNGDADNRTVHYVWIDSIDGNPEVYYCRRGYDNKDDSPITRLSRDSKEAISPVITVEGDNIYVVWANVTEGIIFTKSCDWGKSWSSPKRIMEGTLVHPRTPYKISLAVKKEKIVVVVGGGDFNEVKGTGMSLDSGKTWREFKITFSDYNYLSSFRMVSGIDSEGTVHCIVTSWNGGIRYLNKRLGADRWSVEQNLGNVGKELTLAVDTNDVIHLVYRDAEHCNIIYRRSLDKGLTWSEEICISNAGGYFAIPQITVTPTRDVGIIWESQLSHQEIIEYSGDRKPDFQLLFACVQDGKVIITDSPIGYIWLEPWQGESKRLKHRLFSGPKEFYVCLRKEVLKSNDAGKSWEKSLFSGQRYEFGDVEIYALSLDGKRLKNLTNNEWNDYDINFNPKTGTIAFVSEKRGDDSSPTVSRICIWKDGVIHHVSGFEPFLGKGGHPFQEMMPRWSPDGKKLAFWIESYDEWLPTGLFVIDFDQNQKRNLCGPSMSSRQYGKETFYSLPIEWTPESRYIITQKFTSEENSGYSLPKRVKFDVETGEENPCDEKQIPEKIETTTEREVSAYISNKAGDYAVYVVNKKEEYRVTPADVPFSFFLSASCNVHFLLDGNRSSSLKPSLGQPVLPVINGNIILCMYEVPPDIADRFGMSLEKGAEP